MNNVAGPYSALEFRTMKKIKGSLEFYLNNPIRYQVAAGRERALLKDYLRRGSE